MFSALADYHVHTPLCHHASGWPIEFATRAKELGLSELGFSDHNPMPQYFDDWRMLREDLPRYLEEVEKARQAFPDLHIRVGLECDYLAGREGWIEELADMASWDFLIGSVHYVSDGWAIDDPQHLKRHAGNAEEIWTDYWRCYEKAIRSGLFDFVAHPDLPKKFGYRPEGDLRRFYEPSIVALRECGIAYEINTAGLRKECRELYPAPEFVSLAHAAGVPVLINSDAHSVAELGAGFAEAVALIKAAGYTETARFAGEKTLPGAPAMKLQLRETAITFPAAPLVMGIVNLVADSFSGDGVTEIDVALERARQQMADGAQIIDIGAESARTNREPIAEAEEIAQLLRFIERWPELLAELPATSPKPLLSINTWRPGVVCAVLPRGGDLLNDIGGLPTDENARICADTGAALLLMHTVGQPKVPHTHVGYGDIMARLEEFFAEKMAQAERAGVAREALILDPGIDFAKQRADNLRIYREMERLQQFERPILLPVSRKTVIGETLGIKNPAERDAGTVACIVHGMRHGAAIFRVHNVRAAAQTVRTIAAVEGMV